MKTYVPLWLVSIIFTLNLGCSGSTDEADALISSGWEKFESHDYTGAATDFADALAADSSRAEAFVGLGWTALKLDQLPVASLSFSIALSLESTDDAYAGKAFADLNLDNKADAVTDVAEVVTISGNTASNYTFIHDNSITQTDLLWIKARAHFLMAEYAEAQTVLNILAPSNGLNPESPTYLQDLAAAIEGLRLNV